FRAGIIYAAMNQHGRVKLTVDIACIKEPASYKEGNQARMVLLGQKKNLPGIWRFPGGFVDPTDDTTEFAASRELMEETGLSCEMGALKFVGGFRVADWRDTPTERIFTNFYVAPYTQGGAKGADDLPIVEWHEVSKILDLPMADDHRMLATKLIAFLNR